MADALVSFINFCFIFQEELIGKSIYNIIHVGDHAQFSSKLLPMSYGSKLFLFLELSIVTVKHLQTLAFWYYI